MLVPPAQGQPREPRMHVASFSLAPLQAAAPRPPSSVEKAQARGFQGPASRLLQVALPLKPVTETSTAAPSAGAPRAVRGVARPGAPCRGAQRQTGPPLAAP